MSEHECKWQINMPEMSDWQCHLFGMETYVWRPLKKHTPNAWWRFWQRVILGNRWEKLK